MPELPEVQGLVDFLAGRVVGRVITDVELGSIAVLKTFNPPPDALVGRPVDGVARHGKFVDLDVDGTHLVFHLARAGWLRFSEKLPTTRVRPGKSPIALRVRLDDESGFDLTEAGTKKGLAAYVVEDPQSVPAIGSLGPDPLSEGFTREVFGQILAGQRSQIKGLLRSQGTIAGVGNAYSDEVLHAAKLSPFAIANTLTAEQVDTLYAALRETLQAAVAQSSGKPAAELKDAKRRGMAVHGRAGQECPVCGDTVREVSFADSALQYCPTCQTGGKLLADRRMSRLLK
ncbi:Fpg/Nei family DNA glycosylase [Ornithinimicrobium cryptoxanthini]|uniref:Zf-TFIIB domain-containing protein n=1 Tax=Ornithinimicrobium cryptoxanthini TaxID=2934161 RepID=A0ABY4YIT3_9MICO|nr:DNA-formamidopyrimidine glycosylase family protein [Ornithinimicrobium cryptoxanthini]USQ76431.1 zf-TFIIB domain-containing protein [Ornithinimicrobium cryptoxanthini]